MMYHLITSAFVLRIQWLRSTSLIHPRTIILLTISIFVIFPYLSFFIYLYYKDFIIKSQVFILFFFVFLSSAGLKKISLSAYLAYFQRYRKGGFFPRFMRVSSTFLLASFGLSAITIIPLLLQPPSGVKYLKLYLSISLPSLSWFIYIILSLA